MLLIYQVLFKTCVILCLLDATAGKLKPIKNLTLIYADSDILLKLTNFTTALRFANKPVDLTPGCKHALDIYAKSLFVDFWTFQMFDATSKLQSGILDGNFFDLGAYDECQSIQNVLVNNTEINGKYCLGSIELLGVVSKQKVELSWALCAPDACSAEDYSNLFYTLGVPMNFTEVKCHAPGQDPEITTGDVALIVCFGIIGVLMIGSSIYDLYLRYYQKDTPHPLLLAFSMVTNGEKLFVMKKAGTSPDQMECLSGLRSLSMMWVVLGHSFSLVLIMPITSAWTVLEFMTETATMYVRGATVAVDTFFLMSGIVMIYVYLKSTKDKQCFNVFLYYLHRYLRLTPALAAVVMVHVTVLKHFGSGPSWWVMNNYAFDTCKLYWWSALLYIQNYINPYAICVGQSWYLSVDTQLFFISPIFLLPLKRWPRITLAVVLIAAIASISSAFAVAWVYKLQDVNVIDHAPENTEIYMRKYYTTTYARSGPWFIGIIVGYFIYKVKIGGKRVKINRLVNLALWAAALAVMATCVFYDISEDKYDRLASSAYIAFTRPAWSLGLSWLIFACVTGRGGPVNTLLSLPIFQVIGRLTYSMYLTHFTIILVLYCSTKQSFYFSHAQTLLDFWSIFALVILVSVIWTLAFESPVIIIEKYIFGGCTSNKKPDAIPEKPTEGGNGIVNHSYVHNEAKQI